jgi:hypothetical protein
MEKISSYLALFALSVGEYALAIDCSRFVLKRKQKYADVATWIVRGLAFAGIGFLIF